MSALRVFESDPSPANAVSLAIADHLAGKLPDWPFVDQLRKAEEQLRAYPKLIAVLRSIAKLSLLADKKGDKAAFNKMVDRCIASLEEIKRRERGGEVK